MQKVDVPVARLYFLSSQLKDYSWKVGEFDIVTMALLHRNSHS